MTFLDLFSGVGGFTRGMELAGHKCIGHCEIDKYAEASYRSMHTITEEQREYLATLDLKQRQKEILKGEYLNGEWFANDISAVRSRDIPRADCWCFGFPCQDISIAGKQRGFEGNRSSLFLTVMRLIQDIKEADRPEWLFIENVKNLLSVNRGFDFARVLVEMDRGGYDAEWRVINSKDHGVPQNRERVFIIGHFRGRGRRKVFPLGASNETASIVQGQSTVTLALRTTIPGLGSGAYPSDDGMVLNVKNYVKGETDHKPIIIDDYNSRIVDGEIIGAVTPNFGNSAERNGYKIIANTLCAGDRKSIGTYPIEGGGGT